MSSPQKMMCTPTLSEALSPSSLNQLRARTLTHKRLNVSLPDSHSPGLVSGRTAIYVPNGSHYNSNTKYHIRILMWHSFWTLKNHGVALMVLHRRFRVQSTSYQHTLTTIKKVSQWIYPEISITAWGAYLVWARLSWSILNVTLTVLYSMSTPHLVILNVTLTLSSTAWARLTWSFWTSPSHCHLQHEHASLGHFERHLHVVRHHIKPPLVRFLCLLRVDLRMQYRWN